MKAGAALLFGSPVQVDQLEDLVEQVVVEQVQAPQTEVLWVVIIIGKILKPYIFVILFLSFISSFFPSFFPIHLFHLYW